MHINKNGVDKRNKTLKIFSISASIILIVCILAFNIVLESLLGKKLTLDFSSTKQNSVSDTLSDYISELSSDIDIRIVGLMERPTNLKNTPFQFMVPFLDDLEASSNGKIKVEYKDIQKNPAIISSLDPDNNYDLSQYIDNVYNAYVVNAGNKNVVIKPMNCFEYDKSSQMPRVIGNKVEQQIANAIYRLTTNEHKHAYFLSEVGNSTNKYFSDILDSICVDTDNIDMVEGFSIPDDCDALIINNLSKDISQNDIDVLNKYLNNGGKVFISTDYSLSQKTNFENLNEVLSMMDLHIDQYLVSENNVKYMLNNNPFFSKVDINADYQNQLDNSNVVATTIRAVRQGDNHHSNIEIRPLLMTSSKAMLCSLDEDNNSQNFGEEGAYNVAISSTKKLADGEAGIYLFGTTSFMSDSFYNYYSTNNGNYNFAKCIAREMLDVENVGLDIPTNDIADYSIDESKNNNLFVARIVFLLFVIIPLVFVVLAIVVYKKRKHK